MNLTKDSTPMSRRIAFALLLATSTPLGAQALPDSRVLLPDGYELFLRADMARIQQSEFWRVFSHTVMVKTFLEKSLPERLGIEVDDLKRLQVGMIERKGGGGGGESVSLYLEGTNDLKAESIVETTRRWSRDYEEATVAGRRSWLQPDESHGPSLVEMGPGMVWMASPSKFVRDRLAVLQKSSPHAPSEVMRKLAPRDRGDAFLASANEDPLRLINTHLGAGASGVSAIGLWLQADVHPELVLRVGLLFQDASRIDQARQAAEKALAGLAEQAVKNGAPLVDSMLKKLVLKTDGSELTTEIKVARKDVASVAQAGLLLVFGATRLERGEHIEIVEDVTAVEATPVKPESKPAQSKPAGK
jgi:hypothetical protein